MSALEPHLPILLVLAPMFGALFTAFMRSGFAAWALTLVVSWISPLIAGWMLWKVIVTGTTISYVIGGWSAPYGIEYRVDALNAFIAMLVTGVGAFIMPYARRSVAREILGHQQPWFYTMYLLCLTGLLGIAVTGDAFNVFVFLEVSSLATYALIALGRHRRALLASYQYLILGTIGATLYVVGVGMLYVVTGTLNLADISQLLATASAEYERPVLAALAFLAVGVCLKLALFPLHVWLPNAYAYAPSTATVFLAATATKVAVYLLIRIFYTIYGPQMGPATAPLFDVLLTLSVIAIFLPSLTAVFEKNAKRLLAYSSVAQVGYITFGISLANQTALTGGIVHLFNHALTKAALFMALGAVAYRIGSVRLEDMAGLGRKMPLTMGAFVMAGLGLIGVPGTAGFISKWYLALGAMEAGYWPLVFALVASSLIAVLYVGRVVEAAYFREPKKEFARMASDPPLSMMIPLLALTATTLYFGVDTRASADVAATAAHLLLGGVY